MVDIQQEDKEDLKAEFRRALESLIAPPVRVKRLNEHDLLWFSRNLFMSNSHYQGDPMLSVSLGISLNLLRELLPKGTTIFAPDDATH